MEKVPDLNEYLDVPTICEITGYFRASITKMCRKGEFKTAFKFSKRWYIKKDEVRAWIDNHLMHT